MGNTDRILKTPLIMKSDDKGETKVTIHSGFIGMSIDKEKDNLLTPEIGWYVKGNCNNNNNCFFHPIDSDSD